MPESDREGGPVSQCSVSASASRIWTGSSRSAMVFSSSAVSPVGFPGQLGQYRFPFSSGPLVRWERLIGGTRDRVQASVVTANERVARERQ